MRAHSHLSAAAALFADPARAAILDALVDGRALPAGELARLAGVSAQTASSHLRRLLDGGLLTLRVQGRHRYYAIANAEVAHAIETLHLVAPPRPSRSLRQSLLAQRLAAARTCYNHLGGALAVDIADALVEAGRCERFEAGFRVTPAGVAFFGGLDIDVIRICGGDPPVTKSCIDWTQRRQHISGPLGSSLLRVLIERAFIRRNEHDRSVQVTERGRAALATLFLKSEKLP
ncbi:MAG TPA: helix-turn-helix transcriptional regulator [Candidatus Acidoferrales bacterium]|nr:helix-turn-helix transcriptional regulator [Candidatus Acidoferrales bacterium]